MNCKVCGVLIPEDRLKALPNVKTCVEHSTADKVIGIPVNIGPGDHCYTELNIMDSETYKDYEKLRRLGR